MSDIPDEFMERAAGLRSAVVWQSNAANEIIARALMAERDAERERCAEAANGVDPWILEGKSERFVSVYCASRVDAADAIRNPVEV